MDHIHELSGSYLVVGKLCERVSRLQSPRPQIRMDEKEEYGYKAATHGAHQPIGITRLGTRREKRKNSNIKALDKGGRGMRRGVWGNEGTWWIMTRPILPDGIDPPRRASSTTHPTCMR